MPEEVGQVVGKRGKFSLVELVSGCEPSAGDDPMFREDLHREQHVRRKKSRMLPSHRRLGGASEASSLAATHKRVKKQVMVYSFFF